MNNLKTVQIEFKDNPDIAPITLKNPVDTSQRQIISGKYDSTNNVLDNQITNNTLDNYDQSDVFKYLSNKIENVKSNSIGYPDYAHPTDMGTSTSGTFQNTGWISLSMREATTAENYSNFNAYLSINNTQVFKFGILNADGDTGGTDSVFLPVLSGDTYSINLVNGVVIEMFKFFPMRSI